MSDYNISFPFASVEFLVLNTSGKLMRVAISFIIYLALGIAFGVRAEASYVDSLINIYEQKNAIEQRDISKSIASYITKQDTQAVLKMYAKWLKRSRPIDDNFHTQALFYYSREMMYYKYDTQFLSTWYRGLAEAERLDLAFECGEFHALKAEYFNRRKQYDSLLVYSLKAEKYFKQIGDADKLVTSYQLLADAYYNIELFASAENYYNKIMHYKGDIEYWNKYRKYLILNNLGLVKMKQDSAAKALNYFRAAYNLQLELLKREQNSSFFIRKAYSELCIAAALNKLGRIPEAAAIFTSSVKYMEYRNREKQFINMYSVGGEIYLRMGKLDSALIFLNRAKQFQIEDKAIPDLINTYKLLSEYYAGQKSRPDYCTYLEKAYNLDKERRRELDNSKIIQIKAESDWAEFSQQIEQSKLEFRIASISALVLAVLLTFIAFMYWKLKRANKILVRKTVEAVRQEIIYSTEHPSISTTLPYVAELNNIQPINIEEAELTEPNTNSTITECEAIATTSEAEDTEIADSDANIQELADRINSIITRQKLYLNPDFSVNDLCERLNVNRTYVSKAVNQYLKEENFKSYINTLRTKEVLLLLADDRNDIYTLEALYEKAGFSSRNSFNRAFLKHTGVTPSYYQKNRHLFEQSM